MGEWRHAGDNFVHYWYTADGTATGAHQQEFFAHNFAIFMLDDEIAFYNVQHYFPTATNVYGNMFRPIGRIAGGR